MINILKRSSTTINIATFWENNELGKYNFEPSYQRPSDVWSESKKSFLIDTILKNFPMPPIFLHQHIDERTGKTMYDVIDGKQRLNAVISFIKNEIRTPDDFGEENLSGIYFNDLERPEINDWKKIFWRYEISIEYIDTDQIEIVNNIFDRLNRNGEPLTRQELRNAKYHSTPLYNLIKELCKITHFKIVFDKIQANRLEHEEFVSELLFALIENRILSGDNPNLLDEKYDHYTRNSDFVAAIRQIQEEFTQITNLLSELNIDFDAYKIQGLSHYYGLWVMAMALYKNSNTDSSLPSKLNEFYSMLRTRTPNPDISNYSSSMSANTKSRGQRIRRVNALLHFCNTGLSI